MQFINSAIGVVSNVAVVRCQILEKNSRHSGAALVLFKSKSLFDQLMLVQHTLQIGGRLLRVKQGNGGSKKSRRIIDGQLTFSISHLQLMLAKTKLACNPITDWQHSASICVKFDPIQHSISIPFQLDSTKYKVHIAVKYVRDVQISRDPLTSHLKLSFRLSQPPHLYRYKSSTIDISDVLKSLMFPGLDLGLSSLISGVKTDLLWELDFTNDDDQDDRNWIRTTDPTDEKAFQRCMLFMLTMNYSEFNEEVHNILRVLHAHNKARREISDCPPLSLRSIRHEHDSANIWRQLDDLGLPFSTLYLLHCLIGIRKLDLFPTDSTNANEYWVSFLSRTFPTGTNTMALEWALRYLYYNPRVIFIEDFALTLNEVLERQQVALDGDNDGLEEKEDEEETLEETNTGTAKENSTLVRHVFITPLAVLPRPPEIEPTNRILRQYRQFSDRFLRVSFVDENLGSILQASSDDVFELCVKAALTNGIVIAGRRFVFLAYSNSQIREHSCWFYDEDQGPSRREKSDAIAPTAQAIRDGVGDLSGIKIVGKHAARLGQAFSDTVPTVTVPVSRSCQIPDVERNGYCFSDGCGMISMTYASSVSRLYGLNFIPSAFQIRFGGAKGMLSVQADDRMPCGHDIAVRPSITKFVSRHRELEICSFSKRMPAYLNRQVITILSARGIQDFAFLRLLDQMMKEFDDAFHSNAHALELVFRNCDIGAYNSYSFAPMASTFRMLAAGVDIRCDWYLKGMLSALRNRLIQDIQYKARILVPDGVCLIGVMDESHTLQQGEVFVQLSGRRGEAPQVLMFPEVAVGRSPMLHPGDVRVLRPRDVPQLRHLVDVVVFPSQGNRPHPNEMSGGDLDGDIYFIIWDKSLIPSPASAFEPMDYGSTPASVSVPVPGQSITDNVSIEDIQNFFVNYIKNDNLGQIANAHVVHADFSIDGARCAECLKLAELHSTAVDFIKTGIPAEFPKELRTKKCPSFMSNKYKDAYESSKVLGEIHRLCQAKKLTTSEYLQGYGKGGRLLDAELLVEGYQSFLEDAFLAMVEYNDAIWDLMKRFRIYDEMELLSGSVSSFTRQGLDNDGRRGFDEQARLNMTVKKIRQRFYELFWDEWAEDSQLHDELTLQPSRNVAAVDFVDGSVNVESKVNDQDFASLNQQANRVIDLRAMQKASAWYCCAYSQKPEADEIPLISFPWVVYDVLCQTKQSRRK